MFKRILSALSGKRDDVPATPVAAHAAIGGVDLAAPAIVNLTRPIWQYGVGDAGWLFASKPADAPGVAILAFSILTTGMGTTDRGDDLELMTRAIPLYLAEAVHYWTDHAASCYVEVQAGSGPVVSRNALGTTTLFASVPEATACVVTGAVGARGAGDDVTWHFSMLLWDRATGTQLGEHSVTATRTEFSAAVLAMEADLLARIGRPRQQPLDAFYERPSTRLMGSYVIELGQAFLLVLLAMGLLRKEDMFGEQDMLDWPFDMAEDWPALAVPQLMALASIGRAVSYGSDVLPAYQARALRLLDGAGPAARLAPLVWQAFGMARELQAHRQALAPGADPAYLAWLKRVAPS